MADEPAVTGWDDGLCQDYSRELGRWFADRLGARYELRKLFASAPEPRPTHPTRQDGESTTGD